jgi:hypothetical protein
MGRSYLFECSKCDYKARVSGGADSGAEFAVQTTWCRDCRIVFDSVVRLKMPDAGLKIPFELQRFRGRRADHEKPPAFESIVNRLPLPAGKLAKWVQFRLRCPVSLAHRVSAWNDPGKCPRCGNFMEKNALPFRYWE